MTNNTVLNNIAAYAGVDARDFSDICFKLDGGHFDVTFNCQLMHYHCYVDASSGEVDGFMFEPVCAINALGSQYAA